MLRDDWGNAVAMIPNTNSKLRIRFIIKDGLISLNNFKGFNSNMIVYNI